MKKVINSLSDLEKFAEYFLEKITQKLTQKADKKVDAKNKKNKENFVKNGATVVLLNGDLGSGKTTFVQNISRLLEIKKTPNSPTFVISKNYKIENKSFPWKKLIHLDLYRLNSEREIKFIGLPEQLKDSQNIIFIEWPEVGKKLFEEKENAQSIFKIDFKYLDQNSREINYKIS